jgi:hypothetical protein
MHPWRTKTFAHGIDLIPPGEQYTIAQNTVVAMTVR